MHNYDIFKLTPDIYNIRTVINIVKLPMRAFYYFLKEKDFDLSKKELAEELSNFYYFLNLNFKIKYSKGNDFCYDGFNYFSYAEHLGENINVFFGKPFYLKKLMKTWKNFTVKEFINIRKNIFFSEVLWLLFHEWVHKLQDDIGIIDEYIDGKEEYYKSTKEIQAFSIESVFYERFFNKKCLVDDIYETIGGECLRLFKKEKNRWKI